VLKNGGSCKMAQPQSHISFSVVVSLAYSFIGAAVLGYPSEQIVLASVIIVVAGMLPNIDQGEGSAAKEFGTIVSVALPLAALQLVPAIRQGGIVNVVLLVIFCYMFARLVVVKAIKKYATHRGILHSIPAAIITSEVAYLFFRDLPIRNKIFLSAAAFVGYLSHLLLDAYTNIDIVGRATGKAEEKPSVLKFWGASWGSTFVAYGCMLFLGWFIAQDFYPKLGFYAGVTY
jgi:LexA-binding, inner membrane-associated putative hydrolase